MFRFVKSQQPFSIACNDGSTMRGAQCASTLLGRGSLSRRTCCNVGSLGAKTRKYYVTRREICSWFWFFLLLLLFLFFGQEQFLSLLDSYSVFQTCKIVLTSTWFLWRAKKFDVRMQENSSFLGFLFLFSRLLFWLALFLCVETYSVQFQRMQWENLVKIDKSLTF